MNNLNDVKKYYESDIVISYILNESFFGENMWHTPIKFKYNNKLISCNQYILLLLNSYNLSSNNIVVDWGCGLGKLLNDINIKYKCKCKGFNISERQINIARDLYKNIEFHLTKGEITQLPSNSVDVIVSQEAITHSPNKYIIFSEFYKILKSNGYLIFQDWFKIDNKHIIEANMRYKANPEPFSSYHNILSKIGFRNIQIHKPIDSKANALFKLGCESFIITCIK